MAWIDNPVLAGCNPDPSIIRVGDDYFIATSTFEWFPGIRLHHSRDLTQFRLIGHALTRSEQLEMAGFPDSGGVWAPALSHDGVRFYLTYSLIHDRTWPLIGLRNFLITAESIEGPWSKPVFLDAGGWDPSLFHAPDGRKWLVRQELNPLSASRAMAGIAITEYSPRDATLCGPTRRILEGSTLPAAEGPHLFYHDDYYYLVVASGGTWWDHAVHVARAKNLEGPYEVDPEGPLLTSRDDSSLKLQRAGHGSLVQTQSGDWYLAHLCGRPLPPHRRCILGRETALQRVDWARGAFPRLADGGHHPKERVLAPAGVATSEQPKHLESTTPVRNEPVPIEPVPNEFASGTLPLEFNTLRSAPDPSWLRMDREAGRLSLRGRDLFNSKYEHSLVARRLDAFRVRVLSCVEFNPTHSLQMAGLVFVYNSHNLMYLRLGFDKKRGKVLDVAQVDGGGYSEPNGSRVSLSQDRTYLCAELNSGKLRFSYSEDGTEYRPVGKALDMTVLSDERASGEGFTGTFVGVAAHDPVQRALWAHFDFRYERL